MAQVQQGGPHVRYGKAVIVAEVITSRFISVAGKVRRFVVPHVVRSSTQNEDPEEEKDAHPDLPHHCGVGLNFIHHRVAGAYPSHCWVMAGKPSEGC
uniref:Uncharacterized protein n=1 Tax=Oryzias latipes TaxID=8090 RepID=A0A3P9KFF4_ORYLA